MICLRLTLPLLLLLCAGCITPYVPPEPPRDAGAERALDPVAALRAEGQLRAAAELAEERARADSNAARQIQGLLDAAYLYAEARAADALLRLIGELDLAATDAADRWSLRVLQAQWHLLRNEPLLALERLQSGQQRTSESRWSLRTGLTRAQVQIQLMDGVAAVQALVSVSGLGAELDAERLAALREILVSRDLFWLPAAGRTNPELEGWLALGEISRRLWSSDAELNAAMDAWHARYSSHPGGRVSADLLRHAATALRLAPRHVGILLPLSGRLAPAAEAIRDGFFSAYYSAGESRLQVSVFDTEIDGAQSALDAAIAAGCDLLIGPLQKDRVDAAIQHNSFGMPQLVLNDPTNASPARAWLLSLALPPEDDAAAAARLALLQGHERLAALHADADWAQRSVTGFARALEAEGGSLRDQLSFSSRSESYPEAIQSVLQLERSKDRAARVQHALGTPVQFELKRRADIDALYIAGALEDVRQIRPQVRFYQGNDLPIYASGRLFDGNRERIERDLDGVHFCNSPWMLGSSEGWRSQRQILQSFAPAADRSWAPLHALGYDAYLLATQVRGGGWPEGLAIEGASGALAVSNGTVERRLPCARYRDGKLELVSGP